MVIYMKALKDFSGKEIYEVDDLGVLDFFMYKDVNDSGKTIIHHHTCPNVGNSSLETCPDLVKCCYSHSANSMRVGIVLKLSKAFQEVGRRGTFEKDTMFGDPTKSSLVQEYISYKQMEQGLSGHKKREAPTMSGTKMDKLMRNMELHIRTTKGIDKLMLAKKR